MKGVVRVLIVAGWVNPAVWLFGVFAGEPSRGGGLFSFVSGGVADSLTVLLGASQVTGLVVVAVAPLVRRRVRSLALESAVLATMVCVIAAMIIAVAQYHETHPEHRVYDPI